jgi:hypothetical protein
MRLGKAEDILHLAVDWAVTTDHKLKGRCAIEDILKIVSDYRRDVLKEPPSTRQRIKKSALATTGAPVMNEFRDLIAEAVADFEIIRQELVASLSPVDLAGLTQRVNERLHMLIQSCSDLQV